jgi:hypothetical protein
MGVKLVPLHYRKHTAAENSKFLDVFITNQVTCHVRLSVLL